MKPVEQMTNYELVLRLIQMRPGIKSIHMSIGKRTSKSEVGDILEDLFKEGYVSTISNRTAITEKGNDYLASLNIDSPYVYD
jgi:predicted methyltransferase